MQTVVAPLFTVRPLPWTPPDPAGYDAIVMTSANAARHGGAQLERYRHLPVHAVGEATASAARAAGFGDLAAGSDDVDGLLERISTGPHRRLLHMCGEQRRTYGTSLTIDAVAVYTADAVAALPAAAADAVSRGAVALLHSPRAATLFGTLIDKMRCGRSRLSIVAISDAAANAAGQGWNAVTTAPVPTDSAMLAIARDLCENRPQ